MAWLLAEYLADRPRRARSGEPVPGAYLFVFRDGRWQHAASLDLRDSGRAAELLRRRVRWERETANLTGVTATLAAGEFGLVAGEIGAGEAAFVLGTPEQWRVLFTAG